MLTSHEIETLKSSRYFLYTLSRVHFGMKVKLYESGGKVNVSNGVMLEVKMENLVIKNTLMIGQ